MASCGGSHTAVVSEDGEVYMMGWGQFGSLGLGDEADRMTPTAIPKHSLGCAQVLLVSAGGAHTATLTSSGEIWTWGEGDVLLPCTPLDSSFGERQGIQVQPLPNVVIFYFRWLGPTG